MTVVMTLSILMQIFISSPMWICECCFFFNARFISLSPMMFCDSYFYNATFQHCALKFFAMLFSEMAKNLSFTYMFCYGIQNDCRKHCGSSVGRRPCFEVGGKVLPPSTSRLPPHRRRGQTNRKRNSASVALCPKT